MIRSWLTRLTALLVLSVQAQPLALVLLCDSRAEARESCGGQMADAAASVTVAAAQDDHSADCFRMGPCAASAKWNTRAAPSSLATLGEMTLRSTESPHAPPSFDLAPVTPPPQA